MKNTLWIFGDSFAHHQPGWPQILADCLGYNLKCLSMSSTSLYYSYRLLVKHLPDIADQDKIVFFITTHGRLYTLPNVTLDPSLATWDRHLLVAGAEHLEAYKKEIKHSKEKFADKIFLENFLDALEKYYVYLYNPQYPEFPLYIHEKIIDDIEKIKSTRHLVTSRDLFDCELYEFTVHCNSSLFPRLIGTLGNLHVNYQETPNLLNHFSLENNHRIAEHIHNNLQLDIKNKMQKHDLVQLPVDQWQTYFKRRL
jgi:hypothetical protein